MKITRALSVLLNICLYRAHLAEGIRTYRRHLRRGAIDRAITWRHEVQARRDALNGWEVPA